METITELKPVGPAARILRVPARWLRAECEAGCLPHLKADQQILIHLPTVAAILEERAKAAKGGAR